MDLQIKGNAPAGSLKYPLRITKKKGDAFNRKITLEIDSAVCSNKEEENHSSALFLAV